MTIFEILLQQIGLFVIYLMAGVILVRTKVLNKETLEPISKFVIKMALPVMIFINIIDGVNKEILSGSWPILLIAAGFYVVMFLVSLWMTKFFHLGENRAGIYQAMMLFGNIGFMAVPVISNVFPGNGILYVSVFMIFDQFMLWTLGVKLTTPMGSGRFDPKKLINPATVAILTGMILMLTEVRIPSLLDTGLQKIGATASPLAMIYIGGIFAELPLKKYLKEISLYGIVLVRMLLAASLMFLVLGFFPVNEEIRLAMALITGMPTMTAVVMMANASELDGDYALGGVFVTTVCGIVTLPFVCWLLQYVM
ncbi:AEC family transporter [Blautia glucerasea]|uniref:AEC family transporter n=1 Tax=Blautia glucerasea TaxID=536633 RepID=UPI001D07C62E|nr:AEC family transporter [Blautia glucerasea]MCB6544232.1 AEC family transporter [Blautia glucerasea]